MKEKHKDTVVRAPEEPTIITDIKQRFRDLGKNVSQKFNVLKNTLRNLYYLER